MKKQLHKCPTCGIGQKDMSALAEAISIRIRQLPTTELESKETQAVLRKIEQLIEKCGGPYFKEAN